MFEPRVYSDEVVAKLLCSVVSDKDAIESVVKAIAIAEAMGLLAFERSVFEDGAQTIKLTEKGRAAMREIARR